MTETGKHARSPLGLISLGGLAAILGGAFWVVKGGMVMLGGPEPDLFVVAQLFFAVALFGLHARLAHGGGSPGKIGGFFAYVALLFSVVNAPYSLLLAEDGPETPFPFNFTYFVAGLAIFVGLVFLGIAVWREEALPSHWRFVPLSFGLLTLLPVWVLALIHLELPVVVLGLAWMLLGYVLWSHRGTSPSGRQHRRGNGVSSKLARWSGLAATLGGVMGILMTPVLTFAGFLTDPGDGAPPSMLWAQTVAPVVMPLVTFGTADDAYYLYGRMLLPIYLLFLLGLLGLRARLSGSKHRPVEQAFRITLVGTTMNIAGNVTDYWLGKEVLGQYLWGFGFLIGTLIGTLVYSVGAVMLGRTILHTSSFPRWSGWVLILAPILGISLAFWGVYYIPANFILGNGLGWVLLGYVLWSKSNLPAE